LKTYFANSTNTEQSEGRASGATSAGFLFLSIDGTAAAREGQAVQGGLTTSCLRMLDAWAGDQ
jgi:hypothetical protein